MLLNNSSHFQGLKLMLDFKGKKKNSINLPTANTLPKVNNTANLIGLTKTINDCKTRIRVKPSAALFYAATNKKS